MKEIEFLPESVRHRRVSRGQLVRTGWLLAACLASMAALTLARHGRIAEARAHGEALAERADRARRQAAMVAPLERQMADLLMRKRIDEGIGGWTDCTAVLAELCRVTPPNMALVSLELKPVQIRREAGRAEGSTHRSPRPAAAGAAPRKPVVVRRFRLEITGLAPSDVDVANFIGQLAASCLFEDVNMGYARTVAFSQRMAREFQASCYLVN